MKRTEFRGRVLSGGKMLRVVDGDGGGALAEAGESIGVSREIEKLR